MIEKAIFSYKAEVFRGTMQELADKLEQINRTKELSLGFVTSPVIAHNNDGKVIVECVIQTKRMIKGFRRGG